IKRIIANEFRNIGNLQTQMGAGGAQETVDDIGQGLGQQWRELPGILTLHSAVLAGVLRLPLVQVALPGA
ncbi:MAG: hypothetical protein ACOYO0_11590, partial [Sandarakinorhabdus sp.]